MVSKPEKGVYDNFYRVCERPRGIPYGAEALRPDGTQNHGFINAKMDPSVIDRIPELVDDPHLKLLVVAMNAHSCGLFTIGCGSYLQEVEERGFSAMGFVDLAVNSRSRFQSHDDYFRMFRGFNSLIHGKQFAGTKFTWETEVLVIPEKRLTGLSCTVWINCLYTKGPEETMSYWPTALGLLEHIFSAVPVYPDPIF